MNGPRRIPVAAEVREAIHGRRETARARYARLGASGRHWTDWSRFCAAETYCTSPCLDCRRDAAEAREAEGSEISY